MTCNFVAYGGFTRPGFRNGVSFVIRLADDPPTVECDCEFLLHFVFAIAERTSLSIRFQ
jgi:hypothetical protein